MSGRFQLRRPWASRPLALVLAVSLALVAVAGSRVAAAPTAAVSPAATVAQLLADEAVPAAPAPTVELRARAVAPDDRALVILLATLLGSIALASVLHRRDELAAQRSVVPIPSAPGRSPPARSHSHHR